MSSIHLRCLKLNGTARTQKIPKSKLGLIWLREKKCQFHSNRVHSARVQCSRDADHSRDSVFSRVFSSLFTSFNCLLISDCDMISLYCQFERLMNCCLNTHKKRATTAKLKLWNKKTARLDATIDENWAWLKCTQTQRSIREFDTSYTTCICI